MAQEIKLQITHLGGQGDGVAQWQGKSLYVPYTAPGDSILARHAAATHLSEILSPSAQRQTPPCEYFGRCGGCSLQHLDIPLYRGFKQQRLQHVLQQLGQSLPPEPMAFSPPASRRRVELAFLHGAGESQLAYHAAQSHRLVPIAHCPLAVAEISGLLPRIGPLAQSLRRPSHLRNAQLTLTPGGVDMLLSGQPLSARDRAALADAAAPLGLLRAGYTALQPGAAAEHYALVTPALPVTIGSHFPVGFPPGSFLQATRQGEAALQQFVIHHLSPAQKVVDLYSGLGTFSAPMLAAGKTVLAVEGAEASATALHNAAFRAGYAAQLQAETRDLYRDPLPAERLRHWQAAILNPPRNGALPQCQQLAASRIPQIVIISCHPASFTRDAAHLLAEGYRLTAIQGVDQFLWGPHLEIAAAFEL